MNNNNNINNTAIRVATWNMGSDRDWAAMNRDATESRYQVKGDDGELLLDADDPKVRQHREKLITGVFEGVKADILLVQEGPQREGSIDLGRMKQLLPGYVVMTGDSVDTAVAVKASAFEDMSVILPPFNKWGDPQASYTIVDLKHQVTGLVVRAVSAHLTGTDNKYKQVNDASEGNDQLTGLVARVQKNSEDVSLTLFGLDANVAPSHQRMNILSDAGYTLDGDTRATAFDRFKAQEYSKWLEKKEGESPVVGAKIDHLAMRPENGGFKFTWSFPRLEKEFPNALNWGLDAHVGNPKDHPSDHSILIGDITIENKTFWEGLGF